MDEEEAWLNFAKTGSISDYLIYSQFKNKLDLDSQEDNNATEYGRPSDKRNEYF